MYTIKFQKRGLPHAHILLILDETDKFRTPEQVNSCVRAEIPDEDTEPDLHTLVSTFMIHGPYGNFNENSPCKENGKCTKEFPKTFCSETLTESNGYPRYCRPNNGRIARKGNIAVDNRWIVPYNPWLLRKYQAHINVEICASFKSVKYLYKYVYKGHDCANIVLRAEETNRVLNYDEITSYLNARYIGPTESCWRIFSFRMHDNSHTIIRLPVHLPQLQQVFYVEGEEAAALERARRKPSMLNDYFELNQRREAVDILYQNIPEHFTWGNGWKRRQRETKTIGRLHFVDPKNSELFYLRVLLLHVANATSFENLRTVNEVQYSTFKEAAISLGLAAKDEEWNCCMEEASQSRTPRALFAILCVLCNLTDPAELLHRFREYLSKDFMRDHDEINAFALCCRDLDRMLENYNTDRQIDRFLGSIFLKALLVNMSKVRKSPHQKILH